MNKPPTRSIAAVVGVAFVALAAVLALGAVSKGGVGTSREPAPQAPAARESAVRADPTPASALPEPPWRAKQREAKRRMLRVEGESDPVGAVALISLDPAFDAANAAVSATGAPTVVSPAPTRVVLADGATPLTGAWAGTADELARYLLASERSPRFTVPVRTLAGYYTRYAAEVGLRADILWAQMLHETGFGTYGGSVHPEQNNFAGIGATGDGVAGVSFPTAEAGVKAHVAHMAAYVFVTDRAAWTDSSTDPRYDEVSPRGAARVLSDLDGRWAVPGIGYGVAIERHVRVINSP